MNSQAPAISNDVSGAADAAITNVVAAVIERRGRLLLAQRPLQKVHGGLWEFPGGKVDADETLAAALGRELQEELALAPVVVGAQLGSQTDAQRSICLYFLRATTESVPIALEHMALGWYRPGEALGLNLAPLDRAFLEERSDQVVSGSLCS